MAILHPLPTFDDVTGVTIGATTATTAGPNVPGSIFRVQTHLSSDTQTVTIGCDSAGNGGLHFTGGDPPIPFRVDNLSRLFIKADAAVTVNAAVER